MLKLLSSQYDRKDVRSPLRLGLGYALFLLLFLCVGCHFLTSPGMKGPSSAGPPVSPYMPETVSVEIFLVRITPENRDALDQLWRESNELEVPSDLHRHLAAQGLRVGVHGSYLSPALTHLINIPTEKTPGSGIDPAQAEYEQTLANLDPKPRVQRSHRNLLPNMRSELLPYDKDPVHAVTLFESDKGRVWGKTFSHAQGLIVLSGVAHADGSATLSFYPEMEYGDEKHSFNIQGGTNIQSFRGRPRRPYQQLTVKLQLLQGQWLVIGSLAGNRTGIGAAFFTRNYGDLEEKVLLIRMVKATIPNLSTPMMIDDIDRSSAILDRH